MLKIKKIKPMFTALVTTKDVYESDVKEGGIIVQNKGDLKPYQKVLSIGNSVRNVQEGDLVMINPARYAVKQHKEGSLKDGVVTDNPVISYKFDIINIDGKDCLLLNDSDISYIIEDYEEITEKESDILIPKNNIIV